MADKKKKISRISNYNIAKIIITKSHIITKNVTDRIFLYDEGIYIPAEIRLKQNIQKRLKADTTTNSVNEILNHIRRETYITDEEIKEKNVDDLICISNGILDLKTKQILPFTPNLIFFNKLSVEYNKDAKCKKFNDFLNEIVDKDDISFLKRILGICLIRDTRYQKALMLYGKGGEGKSVLLKTFHNFLGKVNCSGLTLQQVSEDMFAPIHLIDKLANICADIPERGLKNSGIFKGLVTGEPQTQRNLHKGYVDFTPYVKFMFSANQIPRTYDMSDSFFDRWVIITFNGKNYRATGDDIENYEKIFIDNKVEMSGILNWAIEGLEEAEMFGFCDVKETKTKWLKYSDSVYAFKIEFLAGGSEHDWILREDIYQSYLNFCRNNNIATPSAENSFHKKLASIMEIQKYQPTIKNNGKKSQENAWKYIKWR